MRLCPPAGNVAIAKGCRLASLCDNGFEYDMNGIDCIARRNISRHDFYINGFINHYPDFIVMQKLVAILAIAGIIVYSVKFPYNITSNQILVSKTQTVDKIVVRDGSTGKVAQTTDPAKNAPLIQLNAVF